MVIVRNEKTFSYPETYVVLKEKDFAMFAGYRKKIAQRLNAEKIKEMALLDSSLKRADLAQRERLTISGKNRSKIYETAKKKKVLVSPLKLDSGGQSVTLRNARTPDPKDLAKLSNIEENSPAQFLKFKNKILDSKKPRSRFIIFRGPYGDDVVSHELGHIQNATSLNPLKRLRNIINNRTSIRERLSKDTDSIRGDNLKKRGLGSVLSKSLEDNIILGEERLANKNALEILKKAGATPEELSKAERTLNLGYETYEHAAKARRNSILANTVYPEGRRAVS